MRDYVKKLSFQVLVYGLGDAFVKGVGFLLILLYTRCLSVDQFGMVSLLQTLQFVLTLVLSLGLNASLIKVYQDAVKDWEKDEAVSTALFCVVVWGIPATAGLIWAAPALSRFMFGSMEGAGYLRWVFAALYLDGFRGLALAVLRAREKPVSYVLVNGIQFTLLVVTNVLWVGVWKRGIQGIVESQFVTSAVLALGVLGLLVRWKRFRISWSRLRVMVSFGMPLVPSGVAAWGLAVMSQYFIRHFSGMHEVGLYGLGWRFGTLISMVLVIPFRTAWFPFMFSIRDEARADRMYSLTLTYFLFAAVFLALGISILARELVLVAATREYLGGYPIIPLLAAAYVAYGVFNTADVGIMLTGKTAVSALLCIGAAMVQAGLQLVWVPGHGAMGAAWATLLSYVLLAAGVVIWSNRFHPVRYEWLRILKIVGTAAALFFLSTKIAIPSLGPAVVIKMLLWLVFPVALWGMRFFYPQEIRTLKSAFHTIVHRSRRS